MDLKTILNISVRMSGEGYGGPVAKTVGKGLAALPYEVVEGKKATHRRHMVLDLNNG